VKYYALGILAAGLLIPACSPKYVQGEIITVRETQTVYDTLVMRDTMRLVNDRVQVEVVRMPGDKVFIKGTCKGDTVRFNTQTIREVAPKVDKRGERVLMYVVGVLGVALLLTIVKK
jgi:hypothetical protein